MEASLLLSIYSKNTVKEVNRCFQSIEVQTIYLEEIILVVDGPISDAVGKSIENWSNTLPIKSVVILNNRGLANALNHGLKFCSYDWVFRMDIDDSCAKDRFAKQWNYINQNSHVDIVGTNILAFEKFPELYKSRRVPTSFQEVKKFIKYRNPLNHPSVLFRKAKILEIGGYPDARYGQDYLLWIEAVYNGLVIENMPDELVFMQIDKNTYARRGVGTLKYDLRPYILMYQRGMTSFVEFMIGSIIRIVYATYCSIRSILSIFVLKE